MTILNHPSQNDTREINTTDMKQVNKVLEAKQIFSRMQQMRRGQAVTGKPENLS